MTQWIVAGAGVLLALLMPRWKYLNLMGFAGLLGLLLGGALLLRLKPTILVMALGIGLVLWGALLLGRGLPRLFLLLLLLLTMAVTIGPKVGPALWTRIGAGTIALGLLVLGLVMVRFGLRLVWALVGSLMVYSGDRVWVWIGAALGLFIINWITTRKVDYEPPKWKPTILRAGAIALLPAAVILGIAALALRADRSGAGPAGRIADFSGRGLVWPLPSEAMLWGNPEYPPVDNLDARYLTQGEFSGGEERIMVAGPTSLATGRFELNSDIHKLRLIKSEAEIKTLQTASTAIVTALKDSLPLIKPGTGEGAIAKSVHEKQALHGCEADSFPPIIAAGEHAMTIHYEENSGSLKAGDLVLMDVGCYAHHYASDFTRTLPVNGKFTERQKTLYSAVYDAQQAAVKACAPGVYMYGSKERGGHKTLNMVVRETLRAHGVTGDFPHGVGHPLGLFVHDVFDAGRPLQPGMVIMIEPGLYLENEKTGIRLEDAYLVTKDGCELMTTGFPADPDSIEKMMATERKGLGVGG